MRYLCIDQYTQLDPRCPVTVDLHPVDNVIEVTFGDHLGERDSLRLVLDCPDACHRIASAFQDAGSRLAVHLRSG